VVYIAEDGLVGRNTQSGEPEFEFFWRVVVVAVRQRSTERSMAEVFESRTRSRLIRAKAAAIGRHASSASWTQEGLTFPYVFMTELVTFK
jgi:hypothetical protein